MVVILLYTSSQPFALLYSVLYTRSPWCVAEYTGACSTPQSVTAPLQGFLNALVYGWTREDFVHSGGRRKKREGRRHSLVESLTSEAEEDDLTSSGPIPDDNHGIANGRGSSGRSRSHSAGLLEEKGERWESGEKGGGRRWECGERGGGRRWVIATGTGQRGRQAAAHIQNYATVTGIM